MKDRYQRHSLIDWFSQDDVKASSFAVIGCGAVGNEVAKNLALLGVGRIDLFDYDTIEIHNLTRSVLFRESDVGSNKAEVACKRISELDPNIEVGVFPGDFWDLLSLKKIGSYDCVLCCVDNFEARIKLNQMCLLARTNLINTGIDSKFSQIEIFPFQHKKNTACYECNLPNSAYERIQNRYSCGWLKKVSFIEKKIPTTIITSSLTGSLAVANALNLVNSKTEQIARRILTDTFTGKSTVSTVERSETCPSFCSLTERPISILKGSAVIESMNFQLLKSDAQIVTSDPILVSNRCIECNHDEKSATLIFQKASDFDSSMTYCNKCYKDTMDIIIKDIFTTDELIKKYSGQRIPAKFIRHCSENRTTIIELDQNQ